MIYLLGRGEVLLFSGNHVLFTWMRAQTSMVLWNLAIQFSLGSSWSISFFMHFRDILPGLASILFNAPAISVCMLIYIQQPKQALWLANHFIPGRICSQIVNSSTSLINNSYYMLSNWQPYITTVQFSAFLSVSSDFAHTLCLLEQFFSQNKHSRKQEHFPYKSVQLCTCTSTTQVGPILQM